VERVFKTQVRQSLPELNERVQESREGGNLMNITPHNSWHYSTLNNDNNSSISIPIRRGEVITTRIRNEMKN
jgi:hypothetical protein